MNYIYEPYNNLYFATNLRRNKEKLKWDTNNGGAILLFQSYFGEDILPKMEEICEKLSVMEISIKDDFVSLSPEFPHLSVRLIDAQQKAKMGGCAIKGEVSRYTIFACRINGEECHVFEPKKRQTVDIPAEIQFTCKKMYDRIPGGLFRKERMEFAGFYEVTIENTSLSAYHDGDIFYQIHEINIPITEEIIKEGRFYIQTNEMPPIRTSNEGYSISVEVSD